MRLWSIHPVYLDAKGLIACWRESLLAQSVLLGRTKGYKHHPQLQRFNIYSIGLYLKTLHVEARQRNYNFDSTKIIHNNTIDKILVTSGQIEYEFRHLQRKLRERDTNKWLLNSSEISITPNDMFQIIPGEIESWERELKPKEKIEMSR